MKKFEILIVIVIAVVGALLIYRHFNVVPTEEHLTNKFSSEYTLVEEDNVFKYKSIDEVLNVFDGGTGIIFLCTPTSSWCQSYAYYLNQAAKENGITEIYYSNIKDDRDLNTIKYQRLLENLNDYLIKDDQNNGKIYMPDLTFVKNGFIIAHDNETSLVHSDATSENYWTNDVVQEFKNKINNFVTLYNQEIESEEMNYE